MHQKRLAGMVLSTVFSLGIPYNHNIQIQKPYTIIVKSCLHTNYFRKHLWVIELSLVKFIRPYT